VLRLYDVSSGQVTAIRPAHAHELRVLAVTAEIRGEPDPAQLRAWLLPDLIRRCAERRSLVPTICEITGLVPDGTAVDPSVTAAAPDHAEARAALNIHPPARIAPASEPAERMADFVAPGRTGGRTGGPPPFDIGTGEAGWFAGRELVRHLAAPNGAVAVGTPERTAGTHEQAGGQAPLTLPDVAGRGLDVLALRLVFLGHRYRDDLDLTWGALHAAGKALQHWRESVAQWALSPSAPISPRYAETVAAAFEDDLDTPTALGELEALEADGDVPPGAKFETVAALDRLFGLDLARDIGKVPTPRAR
jgi:hypothetical protein